MRTLRTVISGLFEDGLEIDVEDHGTSQRPNPPVGVGVHQSIEYTTIWTFTIRYGGQQDVFDFAIIGKAEPVPRVNEIFQHLFDDTTFEYDDGDFGMWAMHDGYNTAIQEDRVTIEDVWEHWQKSQSVKHRLIELFTMNVFLDILTCDKNEEDE